MTSHKCAFLTCYGHELIAVDVVSVGDVAHVRVHHGVKTEPHRPECCEHCRNVRCTPISRIGYVPHGSQQAATRMDATELAKSDEQELGGGTNTLTSRR